MIVRSESEEVRIRHVFLAVCIALVWGFNFVVIEVGLDRLPPLLFSALRFALAALPAALVVRSPRVSWRWVVVVAMLLGVGQFSLLFWGMDIGMPAGLSSLVLQSQAVFTAAFAALLLSERPGGDGCWGSASPSRASVSWRRTSRARRRSSRSSWWSAPPPAGALPTSRLGSRSPRRAELHGVGQCGRRTAAVRAQPRLRGLGKDVQAVRSIDLTGLGALGYIAFASTLFGFGVWGWLLRRYDASACRPVLPARAGVRHVLGRAVAARAIRCPRRARRSARGDRCAARQRQTATS